MQQQHGSGKTAVLVERIINKIVNEKIDIDKLLIVTFTNAAAAEMRSRIMDAIYKYLDENPEDMHMQKQTILMGKSNICTIHSFCLDVIKNHFYEIDISPNFRIADQSEIELLKEEVLEDIFEEKYESNDSAFLNLINTYTNYKDDNTLKEIILNMYKYIMSNPFPNEWLEENVEKLNFENALDTDFSKTIWGEILLKEFRDEIYSYILQLQNIKLNLDKYIELNSYSQTILSDIEKLEELNSNLDNWDKTYILANDLKWDTWPRNSKIAIEEKDVAKDNRDIIKAKFKALKNKILTCNSNQAISDINEMYKIMLKIKEIVIEFGNKYSKTKQERNIIDFNDIEHFALNILVKKENGKYTKTQVAKEYIERFTEIAIDEYQDSNLIQEYILTTISNGFNIFMVGDVKQSIYKFRGGRPELFLDKYEKYKLKDEKGENDNLKIQLFKNFRSRKNILDITNIVFKNIMSKELGDINYNESEYLNLGANYEELEDKNYETKTELAIIDLKEEEKDINSSEEKDLEDIENMDNILIEAKFVANKIQELINSKYQVYDKKIGFRNITYKDIVILLRATSTPAPIYEKALNDLQIPVFSDTGTQYLESVEIQTIISILKIIDNPMQDIPLVTVLRSPIGGFSDNDLIEIKINGYKKEHKYFYETLLEANNKNNDLSRKTQKFLNNIEHFRNLKEYLSLDELIWQIYLQTGYYNYVGLMPNGLARQANLKMLFEKAKQYEKASFKGLFNFINFIDKLKNSSNDMDSAKLIGENEDVVRVMSIHKSKGLEFPVVFLCNTSKKFNMKDLNENILLHQDVGFGPKYINYERKIQYNTLAKVAIGYKAKLETISEEMRILYVALTRAKEKLIITGISKDLEKSLIKKQELLNLYKGEKISSNILKKYNSYLDWIELVYLKNKESIDDILKEQTFTKEDLVGKWRRTNQEKKDINLNFESSVPKAENENLKELLNWKYEYDIATKLEAKTSVTKIKQLQSVEVIRQVEKQEKVSINKEIELTNYGEISNVDKQLQSPKFMKEDIKITNAQIGTLIHLCIQNMNEKYEYNYEKIELEINELVKNEIISENEAKSININKLLQYTKSDLFRSLRTAKEIHKEQPFYININAKELYGEDINENILVQGIIDLYYIDEKDNLILVDYKTDYVKDNEHELIEKYAKQLEIYKRALEEALGKKVYKTYIYSAYLEKSIEV